jgi:integrase
MGVFEKNESWYIDFYRGNRRIREKVGTSKGEAKRALAIRLAQIAQGRFELPTHRATVTFEGFAERYREYAKANKKGYQNELYRIQQLVNTFGKRRLSDLTAWDAEKLKTDMSKSRRPATVNRILGNVKHMMAMATKWGILAKNPFAGVGLLRVPTMPERILQPDEETRLLKACEEVRAPHLRPIVVLALNTGMRKGEILSLQWSQLDLISRSIHVENGKTTLSDRRIPMNDLVFENIVALRKSRQGNLVFPSPRKTGQRFVDLKTAFRSAVARSGIAPLRFHDLRHSFASRLVRTGADLITVQHLLGHAKITMTARYAHPLADDKIAAVRRLDGSSFQLSSVPNRSPERNLVSGALGTKDLTFNKLGL